MKKTSKKTVTVRKQLKIKLENTLTRRKNARNFRPTNSLMVTWFKNLNKGLFGNKLPTVPLYLVRMTDDWGRCWANKLAYTEWWTDEIQQGLPWDRIKKRLEEKYL